MHYKKIDPYFGLMNRREAKMNHTLGIRSAKGYRRIKRSVGGRQQFLIDRFNLKTYPYYGRSKPRHRRIERLRNKEKIK